MAQEQKTRKKMRKLKRALKKIAQNFLKFSKKSKINLVGIERNRIEW